MVFGGASTLVYVAPYQEIVDVPIRDFPVL
jgi:hypothetical protein